MDWSDVAAMGGGGGKMRSAKIRGNALPHV